MAMIYCVGKTFIIALQACFVTSSIEQLLFLTQFCAKTDIFTFRRHTGSVSSQTNAVLKIATALKINPTLNQRSPAEIHSGPQYMICKRIPTKHFGLKFSLMLLEQKFRIGKFS